MAKAFEAVNPNTAPEKQIKIFELHTRTFKEFVRFWVTFDVIRPDTHLIEYRETRYKDYSLDTPFIIMMEEIPRIFHTEEGWKVDVAYKWDYRRNTH